jgi:hypothetical protein
VADVFKPSNVCLILCLAATNGMAQEKPADEIVLIDEVRIAFYEKVPERMAASMRKAVESECKRRLGTGPEVESDWLCNGESLYFVRGVYVSGSKRMTGLVCSEEGITPNLRYYTEDMFTDEPQCMPVWYSTKTKAHFMSSGAWQQ